MDVVAALSAVVFLLAAALCLWQARRLRQARRVLVGQSRYSTGPLSGHVHGGLLTYGESVDMLTKQNDDLTAEVHRLRERLDVKVEVERLRDEVRRLQP